MEPGYEECDYDFCVLTLEAVTFNKRDFMGSGKHVRSHKCLVGLVIAKLFGVSRKMRCIIQLLLVLCILYGLVVVLEVFLICRPMSVNWDTDVEGSCGDQVVSYLVLELLGLLLDIAIIVVPLPGIWRLQTGWTIKVSITVIFSIGVL